jgi:hypothetical protein
MYYEEKVISGFLCWRSTPDGEWLPVTYDKIKEKLANKLDECETESFNTGYMGESEEWIKKSEAKDKILS